jgi:hypothetical protein
MHEGASPEPDEVLKISQGLTKMLVTARTTHLNKMRARKKRQATSEPKKQNKQTDKPNTQPDVAEPVAKPPPADPDEMWPFAQWDFEKRQAALLYEGTWYYNSGNVFQITKDDKGASKVGATFIIGHQTIKAQVALIWWDVVRQNTGSSSRPPVYRAFGNKKARPKAHH